MSFPKGNYLTIFEAVGLVLSLVGGILVTFSVEQSSPYAFSVGYAGQEYYATNTNIAMFRWGMILLLTGFLIPFSRLILSLKSEWIKTKCMKTHTIPEFGIKRENEERRDGGCAFVFDPATQKYAVGEHHDGGLLRLFFGRCR